MFDALKSLGNPFELMQKAKQIQEKMQQMQDDLGRQQVSADAGGGLVSAVVNGKLEVVKIKIDRTRFDANDIDLLEDVITAAVAAAQAKAAALSKDMMAKMAADAGIPAGMLPNL